MERARVVIADDESIVRTDLKEMLTSLDYLVVGEVGDGRSAVNTARELKPDVVLMDIKMPDLDGIEAAKILTEEQIAPVVLLTAYSQKELVNGGIGFTGVCLHNLIVFAASNTGDWETLVATQYVG